MGGAILRSDAKLTDADNFLLRALGAASGVRYFVRIHPEKRRLPGPRLRGRPPMRYLGAPQLESARPERRHCCA